MSLLKQELRRFGETTSTRGVPRIFKSKDVFLKVVWTLTVLACTAVLVFLMVTLFKKFTTWPVATKYGENAAGKNVFPDITICSLNRYLNDLNDNRTALMKYFNARGNNNDTRNEARVFLNSISGFIVNNKYADQRSYNDCRSFVTECLIYFENWRSLNFCTGSFVESWTGEYSTCQTLKTSSLISDSSLFVRGLTLVLNIGEPYTYQLPYDSTLTASQALGAVITIHSPGTPPDTKTGITVGPGTENIIKISQTNVKRLEEPYNVRGCTHEKTMPGSTSDVYSYSLCQEFCLQAIIYESCNCTLHWLGVPEELERVPYCGNIREASGEKDVNSTIEQFLCAIDNALSIDHCDDCKQPCEEVTYRYSVTSAPWPLPSFQLGVYKEYIKECAEQQPEVKKAYEAYDYFDKLEENPAYVANRTFKVSDMTKISESLISVKFIMEDEKPYLLEDKPQYPWDVMISLVGGMFSLWLGISAMTIFEIFELIYYLIKGGCSKNVNKQTEAPSS